jgi:subtilisin family serine protease
MKFLIPFIFLFAGLQAQSEELLVKLKPEARSIMHVFSGPTDIETLKTDSSIMVIEGDLKELQMNPMVEHVERNYRIQINPIIAEDPDPSKVWGVERIGTKDLLAEGVVPSSDIIVAVIDTGVDYTHRALKDSVWVNEKEIPDNKIDDDGNGYVDDIHGYDFVNDDGDPMDDHAHGTHVSGTIAGADGIGVAPGVRIMGLKFLSASGGGSLGDAIDAINYATEHGAHIMNNSWGGGGYSKMLEDAIKKAEKAGVVFVAAAGNSRADNDRSGSYPANYDVDNVISVAASTKEETRAFFSNYGKKKVHVAAPGMNIYSSVPGDKYLTFNGTSMAAPHVSGAIALLLSHGESPHDCIRDALVEQSDKFDDLEDVSVSDGRINVHRAWKDLF